MSVVRVSDNYFKVSGGELGDIGSLRRSIEDAMGPSMAFDKIAGKPLTAELLTSAEYKDYFQDQAYRWVICNFMTNAILSGTIGEERFNSLLSRACTEKGREQIVASIMVLPAMNAEDIGSMAEVPNLGKEEGE